MNQWRQLSDKYLALSQREKVLILATGLILVFMGFNNYLLAPLSQKAIATKDRIKTLSLENADISSTVGDIQRQLADDPNVVLRTKIAEFKRQIEATDKSLQALTSELIDPVEMRLALQDILQRQPGVQILSMKTLPPVPVHISQQDEQQAPTDDDSLALYQHGIEIRLQGKYFELRNYLKLMETLPWRFYWQSFDLTVQEYPQVELKVTLHSLSRQKEFIGV